MSIIYDASMQELEETEKELLLMGTHFMNKAAKLGTLRSGNGRLREIDASGVCSDLYECEARFLRAKRAVINHYMGAYELTIAPREKGRLAQALVDLIAQRPRIDFQDQYFTTSYASEITQLEAYSGLAGDFLEFQRIHEMEMIQINRRHLDRGPEDRDPYSAPPQGRPMGQSTWGATMTSAVWPLLDGLGIYDFMGSMASLADLHINLLSVKGDFRRLMWDPLKAKKRDHTVSNLLFLEHKVMESAAAELKDIIDHMELQMSHEAGSKGMIEEHSPLMSVDGVYEVVREKCPNKEVVTGPATSLAQMKVLSVLEAWHGLVDAGHAIDILKSAYVYQRLCLQLEEADGTALQPVDMYKDPDDSNTAV